MLLSVQRQVRGPTAVECGNDVFMHRSTNAHSCHLRYMLWCAFPGNLVEKNLTVLVELKQIQS